ncbi:MAG: AMP-binding protein [Gammaproteobacteria bacterium]|jgi:long-chain acyl-CoA synthetase|nr:AMP-binding protein [Gammaproteobacteria bacterium]
MQYSTLTEQARHWASTQPDQIWMRDLVESSSVDYPWGATVAEIDRVAAWLESAFGQGERMALLSKNRAHWIMADLAVINSGNVAVPLFTTHAQATAEYILSFTESKVLFLGETENWSSVKTVLPEGCLLVTLPGVACDLPHKKWEELVADAPSEQSKYEPHPDDIISLVFTSGTTGLPKGVIQTHATNLIPMRRCQYLFTQREQPRWFSYLPLSHIAERQIVEFSSVNTGGEIWFNESLETLARDLPRCRPHIFFGPPRVWEQLRQSVTAKFGGAEALAQALANDPAGVQTLVTTALGLDQVEYCLTAAAPTPPPLIQWWDDVGVRLCEGFGQTEAMGLIITDPADRRIGSIGKPAGEVEVKIGDNDEMLIKAEGCTPGYYNRPEKTAELWQDGWLHTGDKVRIDQDGFIFITGRVKDYFKTIQGKFVAPPPIEGLFAENPHSEQQCLLGRGYSKTVMITVLNEPARQLPKEEIEAAAVATVESINAQIEKHARIGAVIFSQKPWTIENEILTPTMKIRREQIENKFGEEAERLARESAEAGTIGLYWFD